MTRRSTAVHEQPGTDAGVVASTIQVGPQAADSRFMPVLSIDSIFESPQNPRKHFDPAALQELEQSIREKGVLTPVLVRPVPGWSVTPETIRPRQYELAAGHRRFRAAKAAGLDALPAVAREMTDAELLEVLVIENDQREDVHPLEEAAGYQALMRTAKYDVVRIAARIGRSAKYVYDRLKLMQLTPKAQALFMAGKFSAGHAILLARLKPEDQKRALALEHRDRGLFRSENGIPFREDEKDPYHLATPRSVREFEGWIQDRVRAEAAHVDPFLFPETAAILEERKGDKLKPIQITSEYRASDDVREAAKGERILGQAMWKRADGKEDSKTCAWSRVGFVACGPGQGEAFVVCANKDKCVVHWGSEIGARKKRQREIAKGGAPAKKARDRYAEEEKKRQQERDREEAERARWEKARPAILTATAARVLEMPTKAQGFLAELIIRGLDNYQSKKQDLVHVPRGKTAEDLVRHAAFLVLAARTHGWHAQSDFSKVARGMGLDVAKILDEAAPATTVQTAAKGQPGVCRKCGCTEDAACEGGCGWVDKKQTKCSSCFGPQVARERAAKKGGH